MLWVLSHRLRQWSSASAGEGEGAHISGDITAQSNAELLPGLITGQVITRSPHSTN